jgi:K+-sensing histidine kinase KdpD
MKRALIFVLCFILSVVGLSFIGASEIEMVYRILGVLTYGGLVFLILPSQYSKEIKNRGKIIGGLAFVAFIVTSQAGAQMNEAKKIREEEALKSATSDTLRVDSTKKITKQDTIKRDTVVSKPTPKESLPTPKAVTKPAPSVEYTPPTYSDYCAAITQKGTRCKNKAKSGSNYCGKHQ